MLFSLLYRKYTLNVNLNEMYVDDLVFIKHLLSGMGKKNEDNRTTNWIRI